ncbi:hypothetical protein [Noviherbaspirillum sp. UKPF54]|uniref:hypothetical protein n=1 Tax=Noviherbaspirillum sp. UKPF54 TaxID=2601898 RepID=UPI0011B13C34|nr:hypothetical protein [Noviherbaspirillum sp. UKPF54]QDZ26576.1 hypothetical protein FAY22_00490 [Noviherbaspirillum sp. UKPF54]
MDDTNDFKCPRCGRVHRGISQAEAAAAVQEFNEYYDTLTAEEQRQHYGGRRATIESYQRCTTCGCPSSEFLPAQDGDCMPGATLPAVITPEDAYMDERANVSPDELIAPNRGVPELGVGKALLEMSEFLKRHRDSHNHD